MPRPGASRLDERRQERNGSPRRPSLTRTRWARRVDEPRLPGPPGGLAATGLLPTAARLLLVAAAYYVSARLGLRLAVIQENVTPLWPPTGIAVAAFLVFGRSLWPGVALAAFLVNLPISTDPLAAAATATGNTLAPLLAATLLLRFGFRREVDRLRDAVAIVFLGALASMLVSASVGTATLVASGAIPGHRFLPAWAAWWAGDAMGVLVVTPFLLSLAQLRRAPWPSPRDRAEAVALFVVLTVVTLVVMNTHLLLLFLVLPLIGWAAWRFQQRAAAPAALLVACLASWSAAHGAGPFQVDETLFERMLTLQAFNATVAFSSLFFAALVTERLRARDALERSAALLEHRVEERTAELSAANVQLEREIEERRAAERRLRQRERQLADAQQVAHVGSWEWVTSEDHVTWSDEMFRIHGYRPQEFRVTFEKAIELVVEEDAGSIRASMGSMVVEQEGERDLPDREYRIVRADGSERHLLGRSRLTVDPGGGPARLVGTVQDVTEEKRAEREHRIAETLQRSLLPEGLPEIPGVSLAARYVPATGDMEVGGDWYDVVQLPQGLIGLVVGDVVGHGLRAAATMGQLRMALRAYALEGETTGQVVSRLQSFVLQLPVPDMATLVYVLFDPESGRLRFANAGHPPPLLVGADGSASYLPAGLAPPLGAAVHPNQFVEVEATLEPGATLLLYTDGLVERRGTSIDESLDLLAREAGAGVAAGLDLEGLCEHLLTTLVGENVADDIALVAVRSEALGREPLRLRLPADPHVLAPLRQTLRRWLRGAGVAPRDAADVLVACGEACTNAIQHAYGGTPGRIELDVELVEGTIEVTVRDHGTWREGGGTEGGRGLDLMRGLMDSVEVDRTADGTVVRMRRAARREEIR
jgi:PAS domain S-box-containing protein